MKKTTKRIASRADASGEQQLAGFIKKFDSKNAALIRSVRKVLRERRPTAHELVYDNYNFFLIGYCSTERPSDCVLSIAAGANGVGLSFYYGATLPDPHKLLLGSGSQNRFIRIASAATLARPEVRELIAAAIAQAERPLPGSGGGKLVIRSSSHCMFTWSLSRNIEEECLMETPSSGSKPFSRKSAATSRHNWSKSTAKPNTYTCSSTTRQSTPCRAWSTASKVFPVAYSVSNARI
jgi:hypothetical protein